MTDEFTTAILHALTNAQETLRPVMLHMAARSQKWTRAQATAYLLGITFSSDPFAKTSHMSKLGKNPQLSDITQCPNVNAIYLDAVRGHIGLLADPMPRELAPIEWFRYFESHGRYITQEAGFFFTLMESQLEGNATTPQPVSENQHATYARLLATISRIAPIDLNDAGAIGKIERAMQHEGEAPCNNTIRKYLRQAQEIASQHSDLAIGKARPQRANTIAKQ